MTGEEFKGLKVGDEVVTLRDLRVGAIMLQKGSEVVVVQIVETVVWGKVEGFEDPIRFDYVDLVMVKKKEANRTVRIMSMKEVVGIITGEQEVNSEIHLAIPIDSLSSSELLTLINRGVFIEL